MMNDTYTELEQAVDRLTEKRVFFGHQSVGGNVLEGLRELGLANSDIRRDSSDLGEAPFLHANIGRNQHPKEKVEDFVQIMRSGVAEGVDVAFMKFCYIDANQDLTAKEIYDVYVPAMENLESQYLDTTFVYMTMPLTTPRNNLKNLVKRLLNMALYGREENIERHRFNEMLRANKAGTGRLFDIAAIESTDTNGDRRTFSQDALEYPMLVPDYTYDGAHLNELGRRIVAEKLVFFLDELIADN